MWSDTPCIETPNARNKGGYGQCGTTRFGKRIYLTHVLAWIDANGRLPAEETPFVLHHCDNPPCVNAQHLYEGTLQQNAKDRDSRGRHHNQQKESCPKCGGAFSVEKTGKRFCKACVNERRRVRRATDVEFLERSRELSRASWAKKKASV